jgi:hypothetical protein
MSDDKAQKKQLSKSEIRKTIATSLATAFGFVIALLWTNVVLGGIAVAGIQLTVKPDLSQWGIFVGISVVLTLVMVTLIIVVSRWGS